MNLVGLTRGSNICLRRMKAIVPFSKVSIESKLPKSQLSFRQLDWSYAPGLTNSPSTGFYYAMRDRLRESCSYAHLVATHRNSVCRSTCHAEPKDAAALLRRGVSEDNFHQLYQNLPSSVRFTLHKPPSSLYLLSTTFIKLASILCETKPKSPTEPL